MTSFEWYYDFVIRSRILQPHLSTTENEIFNNISKILRSWGGDSIVDIKLSGSRAKGTATNLSSDMDIFVSLSNNNNYALSHIYHSCYEALSKEYSTTRKQNVSIGIDIDFLNNDHIHVDVVPAKRQSPYGSDHSLYKNKTKSWVKTNIDTHIKQIVKSGRQNDIVALKIWRDLNKINFPSIYLECFALEYLKGRPIEHCAPNFYHLLYAIANNIEQKVIYDPANTNNILSNELTKSEKSDLAMHARSAYSKNILDLLR